MTETLSDYVAHRAWVEHPPRKHNRKPVEGPPALGARQAAIADALRPEDRARIKAEAQRFAREALAAFEAER